MRKFVELSFSFGRFYMWIRIQLVTHIWFVVLFHCILSHSIHAENIIIVSILSISILDQSTERLLRHRTQSTNFFFFREHTPKVQQPLFIIISVTHRVQKTNANTSEREQTVALAHAHTHHKYTWSIGTLICFLFLYRRIFNEHTQLDFGLGTPKITKQQQQRYTRENFEKSTATNLPAPHIHTYILNQSFKHFIPASLCAYIISLQNVSLFFFSFFNTISNCSLIFLFRFDFFWFECTQLLLVVHHHKIA